MTPFTVHVSNFTTEGVEVTLKGGPANFFTPAQHAEVCRLIGTACVKVFRAVSPPQVHYYHHQQVIPIVLQNLGGVVDAAKTAAASTVRPTTAVIEHVIKRT